LKWPLTYNMATGFYPCYWQLSFSFVHKLCSHWFTSPKQRCSLLLVKTFLVSFRNNFTTMADKSKILIIGGTGYIGKFIVEASAKAGHPTFALVRESTVSDPVKRKLVENFKNLGVTLIDVRNCTYKLLLPCFFCCCFLGSLQKRKCIDCVILCGAFAGRYRRPWQFGQVN